MEATTALQSGNIVIYPTDTLYALGGDALSDTVVESIERIKGRGKEKFIRSIVADIDMAARYGAVDERVRRMERRLPRGKVTFVVPKKEGFDTGTLRGIDTFGFRIPDHGLCLELCRLFDGPITATSANKSGMPPGATLAEVLAQLGASAEDIALAIDGGPVRSAAPSTVVDMTGPRPIVLRAGVVPEEDIMAAL